MVITFLAHSLSIVLTICMLTSRDGICKLVLGSTKLLDSRYLGHFKHIIYFSVLAGGAVQAEFTLIMVTYFSNNWFDVCFEIEQCLFGKFIFG